MSTTPSKFAREGLKKKLLDILKQSAGSLVITSAIISPPTATAAVNPPPDKAVSTRVQRIQDQSASRRRMLTDHKQWAGNFHCGAIGRTGTTILGAIGGTGQTTLGIIGGIGVTINGAIGGTGITTTSTTSTTTTTMTRPRHPGQAGLGIPPQILASSVPWVVH